MENFSRSFGQQLDAYRVLLLKMRESRMALCLSDKVARLELMPGTEWFCEHIIGVSIGRHSESTQVVRAYWTALGAIRIRKLHFIVGPNHILIKNFVVVTTEPLYPTDFVSDLSLNPLAAE